MTDHDDTLDELASSHLDGETTPEEAARVAADPALMERFARLERVRASLSGSDQPVDPTRRDQAIAAALDAFDAADQQLPAGAATTTPGAPTAVVPLASHRRVRRTIQWVGIAAAVAALALVVPFLDRLDSGSNDQMATGLDATSKDASTEATGAMRGSEDSAGGAAPSAQSQGEPADLGSFTGIPALAASVRSQLGATESNMETSSPAVASSGGGPSAQCADQKSDAGGPIIYTALATLDARPVLVAVRDDPDGGRTMLVLDRDSCTTISAGRL